MKHEGKKLTADFADNTVNYFIPGRLLQRPGIFLWHDFRLVKKDISYGLKLAASGTNFPLKKMSFVYIIGLNRTKGEGFRCGGVQGLLSC